MGETHKSSKLALRIYALACTVGIFASCVYGFFDIEKSTDFSVSNTIISLYAILCGIVMLMTEIKFQKLVSAIPLLQRYEGRGFLHLFIGILIVGTSTFGLIVGILTALGGAINVFLFYKYHDIYDEL